MPIDPESPEGALLKRNLSALIRALAALPVSYVAVRFDGAKGRCRTSTIETSPVFAADLLHTTRVVLERLSVDAGLAPVATQPEETALGEGLRRFTLHWASLALGHWQRGDGGHGVMRLNVRTRQVTLDFDAIHIESLHLTLEG
ncbi:MAG: hypothetical protein Q8J78_17360 [Moraxellaceae bacterium]|nr:hypothetical protein [Moraxellaceae bacterium]